MRRRQASRGLVMLASAVMLASGQAPRSAGLESYSRAKEVLDAGLKAIGGVDALRATKTVRRHLSGDWYGSGQGKRPEPFSGPTLTPPASNGRTRLVSLIDYGRSRWLDETQEFDFTGDFITRIHAVTEETGFETITYRDEKPFYRALSTQDLPALRARVLRSHPEGALLMAWGRPETLQWVGAGEESGRKQEVISFTDAAGTRVLLSFDAATRLLTKSETLRSHPIAGDASAEVIYDDYRAVEGLRLPFHYIDRVAGVPSAEMRASRVELNATVPEERFRPPQDFARVMDDPAEQTVQKLGSGLYLIRGPYNTVFAAFRDFLIVFEAPLHSAYSEAGLELIRATVPDTPIRYVVSTHFHFDHVAGVRPYVAEDVPIVTTPDAREVIQRVASARHTMHPDALGRNPKKPRIETVADRRVFDDGTNRAELYDFGPTEHAAHILAAYFPKQRLLFVPDLWDIISTDLVIAGTDAVAMAGKIHELGLDVERIIPVHGAPGTIEMLNTGLAVRAKYTGPAGPARATARGSQGVEGAERPRERFENVAVLYDWVTSRRGDRLRTFVTRPKDAAPRVTSIFFVGWLSCDSMESSKGETDGFSAFIRRVIDQSGYATVRMDKPGVGESGGGPCDKLDFQAELEGYQAAFESMKKYEFIDPERVFVVGLSNGGGIAPLVVRQERVRGFISAGSWGRTWYEHMLELERARLTAEGKPPGDVNQAMKVYAEFYVEYLLRRRTPGDVLRQHPEWRSLWTDSPDGQYGRPAAFYHQLQEANLGRAWEGVKAPVLVIRGSDDEYMSRADSEAIAQSVNRARPGAARYLEIKGMTHGFTVQNKFHAEIVPIVLSWMKEHLPAAK